MSFNKQVAQGFNSTSMSVYSHMFEIGGITRFRLGGTLIFDGILIFFQMRYSLKLYHLY